MDGAPTSELKPTRVEITNWYAMELIAWLHALTVCVVLSSYALSGADFANFMWLVHVFDTMCPLCFMSFRVRGQAMAEFCQVCTLAISMMKIFTIIIESILVARHIKTLCCGQSFVHIVVLLAAGTVSTLFSLLEFFITHTMATKTHSS